MAHVLDEYFTAVQREWSSGSSTEHTYRPALKILLERLLPGSIATNEPKRIECGAPDYVVTRPTAFGPLTLGYIEAKDIGKLTPDIERTDQMQRYLRALPNLVLTDYLEFRWYTEGALQSTARLAGVQRGSALVRTGAAHIAELERLLYGFFNHAPQRVSTPHELAIRMARLTHMVRDIIVQAFEQDKASNLLKGWRKAFSEVLIAELDQPEKTGEFADMFAQTLTYGLFSARIMDTSEESFTRQEAQRLIPRTNPFLRDFFSQISGIQMDDEPYAGFVDDVASLLAHTDMNTVLADFGRRTKQQDPVVHFYETFLAAYDPKLRESRGVYYTPEPVVSYIVRSVDGLLRKRFGCRDGLASSEKVSLPNKDPRFRNKDNTIRKNIEMHKVLILDPATGTGTFPYAVVDHIRGRFMERGDAGMWSSYVRDHLLPRLFGFELLMAPYAVAHFKLGLQLAGRDLPPEQREQWAYDFESGERLGVYLTNTLEGPHEHTGLPIFTQFVADETNAADSVKRDLPIMVVMGNPPYSGHSANNGNWINNLLRGRDTITGSDTGNYFQVDSAPLGEKNPKWLNDDYVKFIRFAQWRIQRSKSGILGFITNNGYLDNPTFRGMRQALMQTFTDIYILNLHGNSKKRERNPEGGPDENVFDIQQGVCIGIFVKEPRTSISCNVHYADLWGLRENEGTTVGKYPWLLEHDVMNTDWVKLKPQTPFYLFVPQNIDLAVEYEQAWKITEILPINSMGVVTGRDRAAYAFKESELQARLADIKDNLLDDAVIRNRYLSSEDKLPLSKVRALLRTRDNLENDIIGCSYRPFDKRLLFYNDAFIERSRKEVMRHMLGRQNLGLHVCRQIISDTWRHVLATNQVADSDYVSNRTRERGYLLPLYIYPAATRQSLFDTVNSTDAPEGRRPNLAPNFILNIEARLNMSFVPDGKGDLGTTFGPEDVFTYAYAIFHSPSYRSRYAEFLKMDFPRLPLTSNQEIFATLCRLGAELVSLHLMEQQPPSNIPFPISGSNLVGKVHYTEPHEGHIHGRVWINDDQYFDRVEPKVWEFQIGGYQVAEKWLKDRKGRRLSFDDLRHYQDTLATLFATVQLMSQIDNAIPAWPIT